VVVQRGAAAGGDPVRRQLGRGNELCGRLWWGSKELVEGSSDEKRARKLELRPAAFNGGRRATRQASSACTHKERIWHSFIGGAQRVGTQRFTLKQAKARQGDPAWPAVEAGAR
jgi:hypothetical protein